jgi:hypothetical protein
VTVSPFGTRPDEANLAAWRDLGVARVVFTLPSAGRDRVLPLLDQFAALAVKIG